MVAYAKGVMGKRKFEPCLSGKSCRLVQVFTTENMAREQEGRSKLAFLSLRCLVILFVGFLVWVDPTGIAAGIILGLVGALFAIAKLWFDTNPIVRLLDWWDQIPKSYHSGVISLFVVIVCIVSTLLIKNFIPKLEFKLIKRNKP